MNSESWAALITGIIAGLGALIGFLSNQLANRRERKSKIYAEALEAVQEYGELAYRVRRRASSDGPTRSALGDRISDAHAKLRFYRSLLQIDSAELGAAYNDVVLRTRAYGVRYWSAAWAEHVMTRDEQAPLIDAYVIDNHPELKLCVLVMRRELSPWTFLFRRSTRKRVASLREERACPELVDRDVKIDGLEVRTDTRGTGEG